MGIGSLQIPATHILNFFFNQESETEFVNPLSPLANADLKKCLGLRLGLFGTPSLTSTC